MQNKSEQDAQRELQRRTRVMAAIAAYGADLNDCSAGGAIIRYARSGLLLSECPEAMERLQLVAQDHAHTASLYDVLRDARAGRIGYAPQEPEMCPEMGPEQSADGPRL